MFQFDLKIDLIIQNVLQIYLKWNICKDRNHLQLSDLKFII